MRLPWSESTWWRLTLPLTNLLLVIIAAALVPHAWATSLSDLIANDGTISEGDLLFADFSGSGTVGGSSFSLDSVNIQGTTLAGADGLSITGPFGGLPPMMLTFSYDVIVTHPNFPIQQFALHAAGTTGVYEDRSNIFFGSAGVSANGLTVSGSTNFPLPLSTCTLDHGEIVGSCVEYATFDSIQSALLGDVLFFHVTTTILASSGVQLGPNIGISALDETFSQMLVPVPEPSTLVLFGSGLVALGAFVRKRLFKVPRQL